METEFAPQSSPILEALEAAEEEERLRRKGDELLQKARRISRTATARLVRAVDHPDKPTAPAGLGPRRQPPW
jgi:hypothetical protein